MVHRTGVRTLRRVRGFNNKMLVLFAVLSNGTVQFSRFVRSSVDLPIKANIATNVIKPN